MCSHSHNTSAASQNMGNSLGDRSCVRQSKLYRMYESGNGVKAILGSSNLCWKTDVKEGAYAGQRVFDSDRPTVVPREKTGYLSAEKSKVKQQFHSSRESRKDSSRNDPRGMMQLSTNCPKISDDGKNDNDTSMEEEEVYKELDQLRRLAILQQITDELDGATSKSPRRFAIVYDKDGREKTRVYGTSTPPRRATDLPISSYGSPSYRDKKTRAYGASTPPPSEISYSSPSKQNNSHQYDSGGYRPSPKNAGDHQLEGYGYGRGERRSIPAVAGSLSLSPSSYHGVAAAATTSGRISPDRLSCSPRSNHSIAGVAREELSNGNRRSDEAAHSNYYTSESSSSSGYGNMNISRGITFAGDCRNSQRQAGVIHETSSHFSNSGRIRVRDEYGDTGRRRGKGEESYGGGESYGREEDLYRENDGIAASTDQMNPHRASPSYAQAEKYRNTRPW